MRIILASTSQYRIQQLKQFGLEFQPVAPTIDEDQLKEKGLKPSKLSAYLAYKKAKSLQSVYPNDVIIGADQLVSLGKEILGKPHTRENALAMLKRMSGKTHLLITSLCVIYKNKTYTATVTARITLRKLKKQEILNYIYRDQPLDCAGSYKFEKSGLSLVKKMQVSDPSSLIGLPLISLTKILIKIGAYK